MGGLRRGRAVAAVFVATYLVAVASGPAVPAAPADLATAVYLDPAYSPAERAADLVARMTLREKASQMVSSRAPAIPRLRVRAYGWWNEAIHGVAREQTNDGDNPPDLVNTTSYPVSLALAASWDPDLMYRVASAISDEAREVVEENRRDLNFYSPTVNLARDPRWGRNDETYGEDPVLTAAIAAQYVDGMQGRDPAGRPLPEGGGYLKTATTLKHYAANNSEYNRLDGTSDMDERTLREYYTAQFRAVVRASDPTSIMTAYNAVNGVPASVNTHLLDALGRQTFGFTGFYTSDCDAIYQVQAGHRWRPPGYRRPVDEVERHAFANAAGVDLDCQMGYHDDHNYANTLDDAVARRVAVPGGRYTADLADASLVRLFTVRIALGEFDDPGRVPWVTSARSRVPAGTWTSTDANRAVTQTPERLALARTAGAAGIVLLRNTAPNDGGPVLPLRVPATGPYRLAVVGYAAKPATMVLGGYSSIQGEAGRANSVDGYQGLRRAVTARNPAAVVDYLPGTPSLSANHVDPATVAAVASYDAVVVYAGTDTSTAAEAGDRSSLALPGAQEELIRQVAARNSNTVVYLETCGQVDLAGFEPGVAALLWSSYNGQRKGEALADVLLGAADPGGRLPFTWYRDAGELPPLSDYAIRPYGRSAGRTYQYFTGAASHPFGYGLSYTTFGLSAPRVDRDRATPDDTVTITVDVTDTGPVAGTQVVQVYAATPDAPAALERPRKRLVGFRKVALAPGQTARVELPVRVRDLAFFDEAAGRFVVDPGRYEFTAGFSSAASDAPPVDVTVAGVLTGAPAVVTANPRAAGDGRYGVLRRVVYPAGAVVEPRLTVAMTDDTRYGYLADPGPGLRPFPGELAVRYHSNRPDVVAVDPAGTIRTVGAGVATITATVSSRGVAVSTGFVVKVR